MNNSSGLARTVGSRTAHSSRFDWDLIRSFLAVIDAGTLLGAARMLSSSQPTIGRHIEALEAQLGLVLFERTGRGFSPTREAVSIAREARQMQQGAEGLARVATGGSRETRGLVRVSASQMIAYFMLPELLTDLQLQLPEIDIAIVASDDVSNLLRRDADIAIRMVPPKQSNLIARRIGRIEILPCASRSYLERHGVPRSPRELFSHRLIGSDRDPIFLRHMLTLAGTLGLGSDSTRIAARVATRSDSYPTQFAAIRAGLGVGFAADYVIRGHPDLMALPMPFEIPPLPMWLAVHREIRTNPRIRSVYDFLGHALRSRLSV